jgi:hypothetical protein
MKILGFAFILIIAMCNKGFAQVIVKLQNKTKEDFKVFNANIMGRNYTISNFKAGENRKMLVDSTYSYFFMEVVTAKGRVIFQPMDFVGEPLYSDGRLILKLTFSDSNGNRYLNIKRKRNGRPGVRPNPIF